MKRPDKVLVIFSYEVLLLNLRAGKIDEQDLEKAILYLDLMQVEILKGASNNELFRVVGYSAKEAVQFWTRVKAILQKAKEEKRLIFVSSKYPMRRKEYFLAHLKMNGYDGLKLASNFTNQRVQSEADRLGFPLLVVDTLLE